jgi:hypothetical protein
MGEYENKPDTKKAGLALPSRPLPPAPKASKAPVPAKGVPTVEDLIAPSGAVDTQGLGTEAIYGMVGNYVRAIYGQLGKRLDEALTSLKDPPPPPDHSLALRMLGMLAENLASAVLGKIGEGVLVALKAGQFSEPTLNVMNDRLKSLASFGAGSAKELVTSVPGNPGTSPRHARGAANPSATTLLAEFGTRASNKLENNKALASNRLIAAMENVHHTQPAEVQPLLDAVGAYAEDGMLGAWFQGQIAMGWMNFCASLSIGEREAGQTVMPDANKIGGSRSVDWRRGHAGFVEINIDFSDEVNGMQGVTLGTIRIASDGPGAARILRASVDQSKDAANAAPQATPTAADKIAATFASAYAPEPKSDGIPLDTLPVYRRLWLGRNNLDRTPDVVFTPDHKLVVNGNSSLLAAVATGARGSFLAILGQGREEETEQAPLVEKTLNPLDSTTHREDLRLGVLVSRSVGRMHDAQEGAAKLVKAFLSKATTEQIKP